MKIGWVWGILGHHKCLLMKRGDVEVPSDLARVEMLSLNQIPGECFATIHAFVEHLAQAQAA